MAFIQLTTARPSKTHYRLLAASALFAIAVFGSSEIFAQQHNGVPDVVDGEDLAAVLYNTNCAKCHPVGGQGGFDISFTSSWGSSKLEEAVLRMEPQAGPMEPEQVMDLVVLLQDPKMKERVEAAKAGGKANMLKEAPGGAAVDTAVDSAATAASNWTLSQADTNEKADASTTPPVQADNVATDLGAMAFAKSCAGCHAIGGDTNLSGPNLAPTAAWPAAELEAAVKRMEKFAGPMNQDQVQDLVSLLQDSKAAARVKEQQEAKAKKQTASMEKPSAELGEQLFHGELAMANGGMACAACHALGSSGGNMGPDLAKAFSRMGQMALQSACEQGNFKVMSAAYRDHKVTAQEALHLTEYLMHVDEKGAPASASATVPVFGTAGAVALLAGLGFLYRKRNGGPVRRKLVRRR